MGMNWSREHCPNILAGKMLVCCKDLQKLFHWEGRQKNILKESSGEKVRVPNKCWFYDIDTVNVQENLIIMIS